MRAFRVEDLPIESKMLTKALDEAQRKVENYFFDIRKQLFEYDEVLNSQRDRVYTERRRALESDDLRALLIEYAELTMDDILEVKICLILLCHAFNMLSYPAVMIYLFCFLQCNRRMWALMLPEKAGILRSLYQNFSSKLNPCNSYVINICFILKCWCHQI